MTLGRSLHRWRKNQDAERHIFVAYRLRGGSDVAASIYMIEA